MARNYINQQIKNAEEAVERYSKGELTPLEIHLGCDSKKLALSWNETLFRLKEKHSVVHKTCTTESVKCAEEKKV